jgi:heme-degrading monooxygenase HmoA
MIAVIFEVEPAEGRKQDYLDIAAQMRPMVDQVEGFLSVERFQSLSNPDKVLSLSFFADEAAVARWRGLSAHRGAQTQGRSGIFRDYRLRIADVVRDYGMFDREQAPTERMVDVFSRQWFQRTPHGPQTATRCERTMRSSLSGTTTF